MAGVVYNWSELSNGQVISSFDVNADQLVFNDTNIHAQDRAILNWTGTDVVFFSGGKTVHITMANGGRDITTTNVVFADGSKLVVGDNAVGNVNDDGANINVLPASSLAGNDRFLLLGGDDSQNGGAGNDTFVLGNGVGAFGDDTIDGGSGTNDWIGISNNPGVTNGALIDFNDRLVTSADGTAHFSNIENAFGTMGNDEFHAFDLSRVASWKNADFARQMEGFAGNDYFEGDFRDGYFEMVTYAGSPNGVTVNLAEGWALDGWDSDTLAGLQSYTDTLFDIDGVQGSNFNDLLIAGGSATTYPGNHFENLEGLGGQDTLDANGTSNVRADYSSAPGAVNVNLGMGAAFSDGYGSADILIGISGVRGSNGNDLITGDALNNFFEGRNGDDTIDGGGGSDSIFYQTANGSVVIDLATGSSSATGGLGNDTWVNVEGVRGGDFADTLIGANNVDNVLEGLAGNDRLDGRTGNDLVRYDRSPNAVTVNLGTVATSNGVAANKAADGFDTNDTLAGIQSSQDTLVAVENIRGSKFGDLLVGSTASNRIEGWAGADTIDGGTGADTADYFNSVGGISINLTNNNALNDGWGFKDTFVAGSIESVRGSAFEDSITGSAANNTLDGGLGADTMSGLNGIDVYVVDDIGDVVIESVNTGGSGDLVQSSITYSLLSTANGQNTSQVEKLTLIGSAAINGTGNALTNTLTGNDADNVLDGGAGNDTMIGLGGNDTYIVAQNGDVVQEAAGKGIDTVKFSGTTGFTLSANVENLLLASGTAGLDGTGNALANKIIGNGGANSLVGNGGNDTIDGMGGADEIDGGAGNDTLIMGNPNQALSIAGGGGLKDVLVVKNSGITLDLDVLTGDKLTGLEILDIKGSGNNTVGLSAAAIESLMSNPDGVFTIRGNGGDVINFSDGGWSTDTSMVIGGRLYDIYDNAPTGAGMLVDHAITVNFAT